MAHVVPVGQRRGVEALLQHQHLPLVGESLDRRQVLQAQRDTGFFELRQQRLQRETEAVEVLPHPRRTPTERLGEHPLIALRLRRTFSLQNIDQRARMQVAEKRVEKNAPRVQHHRPRPHGGRKRQRLSDQDGGHGALIFVERSQQIQLRIAVGRSDRHRAIGMYAVHRHSARLNAAAYAHRQFLSHVVTQFQRAETQGDDLVNQLLPVVMPSDIPIR